jgi:hypothetical protein
MTLTKEALLGWCDRWIARINKAAVEMGQRHDLPKDEADKMVAHHLQHRIFWETVRRGIEREEWAG